jgi:bifunctional UDP-N-acetylglucosamine pyrophosphorylase/glucosamine-1-phosphate N-acetyltransferase
MMAIDGSWLRGAAGRLRPSAATGEVYLTQLAELAVDDGLAVSSTGGSSLDLVGINDRVDLARAEALLQQKLREAHQRAGVTFLHGETTRLEANVSIAPDVTIDQGCVLRDGTSIGSGSVIGPYAVLDRATIGQNCRVVASVITASVLDDNSDVGPYSHVRAGSRIGSGVHVGNFGEIKNSTLGENVRMGHVSYIGDATIGAETNIGAGVVTCNFDGVAKHETDVGAGVFLGSDTMLVAPVRVADGAATGAGSVVTRDVGPGERVAGVPARPIPRKPKGETNS